MKAPRLSIIIPTRRIEDTLRRRIASSLGQLPGTEILVVEPEEEIGSLVREGAAGPASADEKDEAAVGFRLLKARLGRGPQCNRGAQAARGELLLFLHDDTDLPDGALRLIERTFEDSAVGAACFRLRFDKRNRLLGVYAFFTRFDSLFTTFGDQGIIIRRSLFEKLGGFPDWPLFEDVELGRRVRHHSRMVKLPAAVTTSAERFERNGVVRQQLRNAWLMLRFLLGATPETLAASYERHRSRSFAAKKAHRMR